MRVSFCSRALKLQYSHSISGRDVNISAANRVSNYSNDLFMVVPNMIFSKGYRESYE